ncbi:MAG: T9SS type A sorting domain-containing protein [Flavobacteriaceae bacterium]|nr:T9SS type A sorting domain-containing protein [Flavobacteriaceae bacterium]
MKKVVFYLLILTQIVCSQTIDEPLDVLFIGNSITYFNNLPQTFEQIADEQGNHVTVAQHTPGGTGFVHHVNNNSLYAKFREKQWDYVILQPGSNESPGFSYPIAETITRAKRLKDSIIKYSPCASIHYYEISYGIITSSVASFNQYLDRQTLIKNNLIQMAGETNIPFAPIGECFKNSMIADDTQFLWGGYGDIHPNAKGSYMAACSFYNSLFKERIENTNVFGGVTEQDAAYLRNQAEETTFNLLDDALITMYTSTANFNYTIDSPTNITFTNTSSNYDTLLWDFGDGITSTSNIVSHEFDFVTNASYTVVLTAYKDCKEHHKVITVSSDLLSTENYDLDKNMIMIFPNPTQNMFYVKGLTGQASVNIYTINGSLVLAQQNYIGTPIDITHLASGVYFVKTFTKNAELTNKLVKY